VVRYLTADPRLATKLARVIAARTPPLFGVKKHVEFVVTPWPRLDSEARAAVRAAIDAAAR
jgi:hypothetical protein